MSMLLEVRGLTVRYGGVTAVDDVSLSVAEGEVVGLIGPNGAGKTTCIDALSGFRRVDEGAITFDGRRIEDEPPHRRARRGFARTFQSLDLFDDLTVRENLVVAASTPSWRSTITDALWPKRQDQAVIDEHLDLLGLGPVAERRPSELPNGVRHLVALARALVARPRLVLLDEPAAGLDATESAALGPILRALPERGISVLLVDHDMSLVLGTCDRVAVLDFGRLIATGSPEDIRNDQAVVDAYLGTGTAPVPASAATDEDPATGEGVAP